MNKVILLGRLTKDPETRTTQTGKIVSTFTLAVNRRFSKQREADFINCVAWGKNAEFVDNYCKKGRQFAVVGSIQTRSWDDNEGKRHYMTEVIVDEIYFADSKRDGGGSPGVENPGPYQPSERTSMVPPTIEDSDENQDEDFYPEEEGIEDLPF